jgi:hypothetical protein
MKAMRKRLIRKPPDLVAAGVRWRKVEKAQTWRSGEGEILQGKFVRTRQRTGQYGTYSVHTIRMDEGAFAVSGSVLDSLIGDVGVMPGDLVRVVYTGLKRSGSGDRTYKDFELYLAVQPS